jgi:uncharacterized membrane protein HdeD (DUF308 family)
MPMSSFDGAIRRLSSILLFAGAVMIVLATIALAWPGDVLVVALVTVGPLAVAFGAVVAALALVLRRETPRWWLLLYHGLACGGFGVLMLASPSLSLEIVAMLVATWLALYAGFLITLSDFTWRSRPTRWSLAVWAAINLGLAVAAATHPHDTVVAVLFFGAMYLAVFGVWQVAAALWLRRVTSDTAVVG